MARSTMSYLITEVEQLIDDTSNTYFTDDQIQAALDTTRVRLMRVRLHKDVVDKTYIAPEGWLEGVVDDDTGSWTGSPTVALWDGRTDGASEITPDAWSLREGVFTFTSDQDDVYYLDAWAYDPYLAAGRLCQRLAARSSITPGWGETGGAIRGRRELLVLAREYFAQAKPRVFEVRRIRKNAYSNY